MHHGSALQMRLSQSSMDAVLFAKSVQGVVDKVVWELQCSGGGPFGLHVRRVSCAQGLGLSG